MQNLRQFMRFSFDAILYAINIVFWTKGNSCPHEKYAKIQELWTR